MRALTIWPDGTAAVDEDVPADSDGQTTWLQERVGGYFEVHGTEAWGAFVNENGGHLRLAPNHRASELIAELGGRLHLFVGPVVFVGADTDDGGAGDVPDLVLDMARDLEIL